jgi:hypothetical protein
LQVDVVAVGDNADGAFGHDLGVLPEHAAEPDGLVARELVALLQEIDQLPLSYMDTMADPNAFA